MSTDLLFAGNVVSSLDGHHVFGSVLQSLFHYFIITFILRGTTGKQIISELLCFLSVSGTICKSQLFDSHLICL